jgi:hypothetical protein
VGNRLTDPREVLFRNIHPSWIQDGKPTSQAFRPTLKDEGRLSLDRGSMTTAQDSFRLHTCAKGLQAEAVYGVSVDEFLNENIECFDDPIEGGAYTVENLCHCIADFRPHGGSKPETISKKLKKKAIARGSLYP